MMREQTREGGNLCIICAVSSKAHIRAFDRSFGRQARHDTAPRCFRSPLAHHTAHIHFVNSGAEENHM